MPRLCKKINKRGWYPTRFPPAFASFSSSLTTAAKPRQIMPLGCPCCYKRQVLCRHHSKLSLFSPTPLTLHSCIAKHHLLLFCPEQSQLTRKKKRERKREKKKKKSMITAVAKQKPNKGRRKRLETSSTPEMTQWRGRRKTFTLAKSLEGAGECRPAEK